jgi:hypothetical protein
MAQRAVDRTYGSVTAVRLAAALGGGFELSARYFCGISIRGPLRAGFCRPASSETAGLDRESAIPGDRWVVAGSHPIGSCAGASSANEGRGAYRCDAGSPYRHIDIAEARSDADARGRSVTRGLPDTSILYELPRTRPQRSLAETPESDRTRPPGKSRRCFGCSQTLK